MILLLNYTLIAFKRKSYEQKLPQMLSFFFTHVEYVSLCSLSIKNIVYAFQHPFLLFSHTILELTTDQTFHSRSVSSKCMVKIKGSYFISSGPADEPSRAKIYAPGPKLHFYCPFIFFRYFFCHLALIALLLSQSNPFFLYHWISNQSFAT